MDVETMRYYYVNGLWPLERLDRLLQAGKITSAEYDAIVKEAAGDDEGT